ncbi:MAG: DUF4445 domain-containing protein [Clostridia bacterium]|nr:DUF4445 domain-containing protein [Clostridia bacterium]
MTYTLNHSGVTIADALAAEGISFAHPCGGKGKCGKCRVHAVGALSEPTANERTLCDIAGGWRLSCEAVCLGEVTVTLPDSGSITAAMGKDTHIALDPPLPGRYGAAIDIGTTTIAARRVDLVTGDVLSAATARNPQSAYGADVVSRIEFALNSTAPLTDCIRTALRGLFDAPIDAAVITGNTAMLHFLCGLSTDGMACAPFTPSELFGRTAVIDDLPFGRIYLPPCMSAFVGADITTAILASGMLADESALLVDIGTNGEMALWRDGKLTCASTAAGPAFEGAEISSGVQGIPGAIDSVRWDGEKLTYTTIQSAPPCGICGSGLISAVAALLDSGILDESGYLAEPIEIGDSGITLDPTDIRKLQLAKSAIRAGIDTLAADGDISRFYLAGGFGSYLDIDACIRIGLLPEWVRGKLASIGNAALTGAEMILKNRDCLHRAEELAKSATLLSLEDNERFCELYIENMLFGKETDYD